MKTKTTFSTYFFDSVAAQIINRHTQEGLTNKEIVCCLIFNIYWETDSTMYHNSVQIYCNMMLSFICRRHGIHFYHRGQCIRYLLLKFTPGYFSGIVSSHAPLPPVTKYCVAGGGVTVTVGENEAEG